MENLGTKTIDEMGRIIVPKEVRKVKGWNLGDKLTFQNCNGVIVLEALETSQTPKQKDDNDFCDSNVII